jgi:uncharacterized protein involved in outer membrane biogenesis
MNSFLLWCGALLAAVLTALFAVPHFIDWNLYRGQFEAEASRVLGREVRVAGGVSVDILPSPRMRFERVRIADVPLDPGEIPGDPLLRAERLELGIGLSGLMRGALDVHTAEIVRPELRLTLAADGRGNWQTLKLQRDTLPMSASTLTVGSVAITNGQVTIVGPDGQNLMTLANVAGDLESSGGPVRFRGLLDWAGGRHELRLSTADSDGGVLRMKASVRALASGNTVSFDGALNDLTKVPRLNGEVTARMAIAGATVTSAATPSFELRGRIDGDGRGARLDDLALAFERDGQPQLVTGSVATKWTTGLDVDAALESRWLDLDRMTAKGDGVRPLDVARSLVRALDAVLPDRGKFRARVAVDQITLGGDVASNVSLVIGGQDGALRLDRLEAGLPGSGYLDVSGRASADASSFEGRMLVRAASTKRLLEWAARGSAYAKLDADGAAIVDAAIRASDEEIVIDRIVAEVAGQPLRGSLRQRFGARPQTDLSLTAADLDVSALMPGVLGRAQLMDLAGWRAASGTASSPARRWLDPAQGDVRIALVADRISDGSTILTKLDADIERTADALNVRKLKATVGDGLALDLTGTLQKLATPEARTGSLYWTLAARDEAALDQLKPFLPAGKLPASALPLRLGGSYVLPAAAAKPAEFSADGSARATRIRILGQAARSADDWRNGVVEGEIDLDGPQAFALAGLAEPRAETGPSRLSLRFSGVPSTGMLTLAEARAQSPAADLRWNGRMTLADRGLNIVGRLTIDARDARDLVRLSGLPAAQIWRDVSVQGTIGLAIGAEGLTVALDRTRVAGVGISGAVLRDPAGKWQASVVTDRLVLRDLLAPLVQPAPPATPSVAPLRAANALPASETDGPWPDQPFDLAAATSAPMEITLATPRLEIDSAAALQDVTLTATLGPGKVALTNLTASVLDGKVTGAFDLVPGPVDVGFNGRLEFKDVDLGSVASGAQAAKGTASARLSLESRGLSPRSLLQSARGKGDVELKGAALPGLDPAAIQRAAQSFLATEGVPAEGQLETLVRTSLARGTLNVGTRTIPLEVSAGVLKIGQLRVEAPEAILTNRTTLDLGAVRADSEWRAEPKTRDVGTKRRDPLPPVSIVWSGSAWDLARREARIEAEDLSRELTVRLMERDVEELERLRRLDEQRAREEAQRRQAFEEARAAEAAARAAAAVAAGSATAGSAASPVAPPPPGGSPATPGTVVSGTLPPPTPTGPQPVDPAAAPPPAPKPAVKSRPSEWWGNQYLFPQR